MPATDPSPLRLAIIVEARTWLGTPFRHQGRTRGAGVDCAGVVIGVARALGLSEFDTTAYGRLPNGHAMRRLCDAHLRPILLKTARPGDVLLMAWRRYPQHLAVVVDHPQGLGIVHGHEAAGRVVEHRLDEVWRARVRAAYAFPGVL
jgi:cell wall-associated NlpC family hydrolase